MGASSAGNSSRYLETEGFGSMEVFLVESKVLGFVEACAKATSLEVYVKVTSSVEENDELPNATPSLQGNATQVTLRMRTTLSPK